MALVKFSDFTQTSNISTAFLVGYQALNIRTLPGSVSTDLTNAEFWGNNLAEVFTQKCVDAIEAVLGPDTCTIDKSNPFE